MSTFPDDPSDELGVSTDDSLISSCGEREGYRYRPDGPAITPSLLFTEEEAKSVDWEAVFREWQ